MQLTGPPPHCLVRGLLGWIALCWALLGASSATAAAELADEASVKAAYLYKFLGFVEWPAAQAPADAAAPIAIGVSRSDAVLRELRAAVAGRTVEGRPIEVRPLEPGAPTDGLHLVFLGGAQDSPPQAWLERLRGQPLLLVSEGPGGLRSGSALNFVMVDGRVRFEAAPQAAERNGLKLSSRLLAVAQRVVGAP